MRKLLVADDTQDILVLLRLILGGDFEIVAEARDGEEAVSAWHEHREDMFGLVLDYRMPRMTGLEAARAILAIDPEQRIVLFSANFDDELRQEALDAGVRAVVDKQELIQLASHPALAA